MIPIRDTVQARNMPLMTWALILLNSLVFFYELAQPPELLEWLVAFLGMVPARLGSGPESYWTLLTSMFLHGGWMHFIGNMWCLYLFGDNVEDRMGSGKFLVFYLLSGLAAGLTHYFIDPSSSLPTIGASGAIAGVMGAYFVLYPRSRVLTLFPLPFDLFEVPAVFFLCTFVVVQLPGGLAAVAGTAAGLATGAALCLVLRRPMVW